MSGQISSPWLSQNELYYPRFANQQLAEGEQKYAQNQLMMQEAQQTIGSNEQEMMARAASGLLTIPDETARAAAYPGAVADLQRNGFAKNAPSTYPGEAGLRRVAAMGMSAEDQYKMGLVTAPGLDAAIRGANAPLPGQAGYGGGAAAPAASGGGGGGEQAPYPAPGGAYGQGGRGASIEVPQEYLPFYKEASDKFHIPMALLIAQHRQESGFNANAVGRAGEIGIGQVMPSTALSPGYGQAPVDPATLKNPRDNIMFSAEYLARRMRGDPGDPEVQRRALVAYNGGGDPNYVQNVTRYLPSAYPQTQTAAIQAQPAPSPAPAPAPAPAPQPIGTQGLVRNADGSVGTPNAGGLAVAAPTAPAGGPQPGEVQVAGPGAPTAPAPPSPAPPPPPAPAPQAQQPPLATGTESPQFQAALELNRRAQALEVQYPYSPQAKAMAASLRAQAALYMQADSVSVDPNTGIQTKALTGERLNAAAPNAHYEWDAERGAYVDRTGTHPPVTPPAPRGVLTPSGDVVQPQAGGGAKVIYTVDPSRAGALKAAEAQGTATGTAVAGQVPKLMDLGRSSAQAIGNIDYGMSQVDKAKAGGIPTGYFASWLAPASAAMKSLGLDPSIIGVDPKAVGNIQTAQKTLAVVSGAILQQILGGQSDITDAKLQHFIHAQPGIETDPDALNRVLNWARTQFVYEREMAKAGMDEASKTGMLPPNWQASYFASHGFAPIYNPGTGEMQQPDGGAPTRNAPASPAPINPSARQAGRNYQTPQGELKWTGTGWVQP